VRYYHGTDTDSADAFSAGAMLDAEIAAERHIDGDQGFYLASSEGDAEFFALRRSTGRVIAYEVTASAYEELVAAGATQQDIPGRPPPYFEGQELFVPTALFPLFNRLQERGEIRVV
jgi:hypothetical protein